MQRQCDRAVNWSVCHGSPRLHRRSVWLPAWVPAHWKFTTLWAPPRRLSESHCIRPQRDTNFPDTPGKMGSDLGQTRETIQATRGKSHQETLFHTSVTSSRTSSIVTTWKRLPLPSDFRTMQPLDREITFCQVGTSYKGVQARMRWKFCWPFCSRTFRVEHFCTWNLRFQFHACLHDNWCEEKKELSVEAKIILTFIKTWYEVVGFIHVARSTDPRLRQHDHHMNMRQELK